MLARRLLPLLASSLALLPLPTLARPIAFAQSAQPSGTIVLPLRNAEHLTQAGGMLDEATRQAIARALEQANFDFGRNKTLSLRGVGPWTQILVVGTGPAPFAPAAVLELGGIAARETASAQGPVTLVASTIPSAGPDAAYQLALGAQLRSYSFNKYKATAGEPSRNTPLTIVTADPARAQASFTGQGDPLGDAVHFARDLVNEPANALYPEVFVERTREAFRGVPGITIRVLDEAAMRQLGMGSILSVGKGSARPPRMLAVHYRGAGGAPLAIAGKGITFDSGGISLKPGDGMWRMKGDMAGAASAIGAVLSLARSRAPVHVVGIAALAENMPSGTATRPGDVVRAMNGRTIEVINTDAEGRLVLADAVAYAEREYRPSAIVTIATLTGAKVTALGDEYAGLFSRHDDLARQLDAAGTATGELAWRLPLHPNHAKDMDSDIADIRNTAEGGSPGASLGAHFISFFAERTPWAHLDVAGSTLSGSASELSPVGANGFGVRLLDQFARSYRPGAPGAAAGGQ